MKQIFVFSARAVFRTRFIVFLSYLFLLSLLIPNLSAAQTNSAAFHFPKYAFQFQVSRAKKLLRFYPLRGSMLSAKIRLNRKASLRLGITSVEINTKADKEYFRASFSTTDTLKTSGNRQQYSNVVYLYYLFYPFPNRTVKWYLGTGTGFGFKTLNDVSGSNKSSFKTTLYALSFITGVEWFINRNFSLGLEYGLTANYIHDVRHIKVGGVFGNTMDYKSAQFQILPWKVALGLSIYFDFDSKKK